MSEEGVRFSRAFKLKAIERMDAGENVSALSPAQPPPRPHHGGCVVALGCTGMSVALRPGVPPEEEIDRLR